MRVLVVFDGKSGAEQNLRVALDTVNAAEVSGEDVPELLVCVLQLLREDKPLDDYLGDMERATDRALEKVVKIVSEVESKAAISLILVGGMEPEAAELIASEAREWQTDQIFMSLDEECAACKTRSSQGPSAIGRLLKPGRKSKKDPGGLGQPGPYVTKTVSLADLLALVTCPIRVTCHGEVLFSMYRQRSRVKASRENP